MWTNKNTNFEAINSISHLIINIKPAMRFEQKKQVIETHFFHLPFMLAYVKQSATAKVPKWEGGKNVKRNSISGI